MSDQETENEFTEKSPFILVERYHQLPAKAYYYEDWDEFITGIGDERSEQIEEALLIENGFVYEDNTDEEGDVDEAAFFKATQGLFDFSNRDSVIAEYASDFYGSELLQNEKELSDYIAYISTGHHHNCGLNETIEAAGHLEWCYDLKALEAWVAATEAWSEKAKVTVCDLQKIYRQDDDDLERDNAVLDGIIQDENLDDIDIPRVTSEGGTVSDFIKSYCDYPEKLAVRLADRISEVF